MDNDWFHMKTIVSGILLIVLLSLPFWLQFYAVRGGSMEPVLSQGDVVLVDTLSIKFFPPRKGEILVFRNPHGYKDGDSIQVDIKRIAGLPGETVEGMYLGRIDYFVMGDNRAVSTDSRRFGAVQPENFVGRPFLRISPLSRFTIFPLIPAPAPAGGVQ